MKYLRGVLFIVLALVGTSQWGWTDSFIPIPTLTGRVIVVLQSTHPEEIEQYSIRVLEQWKLGAKGQDDGFLITVALQDHRYRLDVGYGLEGVIPDASSNRILDESLKPALRAGKLGEGLVNTLGRIDRIISGSELAPHPYKTKRNNDDGHTIFLLIIGGFVVAGFLRGILGQTLSALIAAALAFIIGYLCISVFVAFIAGLVTLVAGLLSSGTPGSGGFYIGSGGGGGFGGGFSGGGGSFGGGGSSGSW